MQDVCSQKTGISKILAKGDSAAFPDSIAFYIYAYVITLRKHPRKPDSILASTACKFDGDRVVILKKVSAPLSFYTLVNLLGWLNHIRIFLNDLKSFLFSFHDRIYSCSSSATTNVLPPIKTRSSLLASPI